MSIRPYQEGGKEGSYVLTLSLTKLIQYPFLASVRNRHCEYKGSQQNGKSLTTISSARCFAKGQVRSHVVEQSVEPICHVDTARTTAVFGDVY